MQAIVCIENHGLGIETNLDGLALIGTQIDGNRRVGSGVVRDFVQNIVTLAIYIMGIRLIVCSLIIPNCGVLALPCLAAIVGDDHHELIIPTGLVGLLCLLIVCQSQVECQLSLLGIIQYNQRREHPFLLRYLGGFCSRFSSIATIERSDYMHAVDTEVLVGTNPTGESIRGQRGFLHFGTGEDILGTRLAPRPFALVRLGIDEGLVVHRHTKRGELLARPIGPL